MNSASRISPFAPYNPFQVRSRALRTSNVGLVGAAANSFASFTTTNTSDWQDIGQRIYSFPSQQMVVLLFVTLHIQHSAANAEFGFRVVMHQPADGSAGANFVMWMVDELILPATANKNLLLDVSPVMDFNAPATIQPGRHLVVYQVRNRTAGTLTVTSATAGTSDMATLFTVGSVTQ